GTFPQITADYGISSYFRSPHGGYINLYVPSKLTWRQNGARCTMVQKTNYPYLPQTSIELSPDRPVEFTVALRIPEWAGNETRVAVSGKRDAGEIRPGTFFSVTRTWKKGDRIEMEFDMPKRLDAVDPQHPNTVALMYGPLSLFAVGESFGRVQREQLLQAQQMSIGSSDWNVMSDSGKIRLTSFGSIQNEKYRLYHEMLAGKAG